MLHDVSLTAGVLLTFWKEKRQRSAFDRKQFRCLFSFVGRSGGSQAAYNIIVNGKIGAVRVVETVYRGKITGEQIIVNIQVLLRKAAFSFWLKASMASLVTVEQSSVTGLTDII